MTFLTKLSPYLKAVLAGVIGAVLPLLSIGLTHGFDWKAILSAAVTGAVSAITVFLVPNKAAA